MKVKLETLADSWLNGLFLVNSIISILSHLNSSLDKHISQKKINVHMLTIIYSRKNEGYILRHFYFKFLRERSKFKCVCKNARMMSKKIQRANQMYQELNN
jgi:hypothetical protein